MIPIGTVLVMGVWSTAVTAKHGLWGLIQSRFLYPFWRAYQGSMSNNLSDFVDLTLFAWGPQLLLALTGACIYLWRDRKSANYPDLTRSFLDTMCVWLFMTGITVAIGSRSPSYLYVVAVPSAVLAGIALSHIRSLLLLIPVLVLMAGFQITYNMKEDHLWGFKSDTRARILAAACYLVEQRPDLLTGSRTPFVTAFEGEAAVQYARPATRSIRIPTHLDIPYGARDGDSAPHPFRFALEEYGRKEFTRPWIIMSTDVLHQPSRSFGLRLLDDPDISWMARFPDSNGETIYLGEYTPGTSRPANQAPSMDVPSLSRRWLRHYDRLRFLSHNLQYINHF
ncbi:MAG: hypothetical protein HY914_02290 [Desulfomonile tiedjei]|nr:hypothetical protein [Desulfomonile tiedjei]